METVVLFPFVARTAGKSLQGSTKARVVPPPHQTQSMQSTQGAEVEVQPSSVLHLSPSLHSK